jgi:hypothetical protein
MYMFRFKVLEQMITGAMSSSGSCVRVLYIDVEFYLGGRMISMTND